jgi:hypothetical protein
MKRTPEEPVPYDAKLHGNVWGMMVKPEPVSCRRCPYVTDRAAHPSGRHH